MTVIAFDRATPSRPRQHGVSQRIVQAVAAAQHLLADTILPTRGSHPALTFRGMDRA